MVHWIMTGAALVQERGYEWGWKFTNVGCLGNVGYSHDVFHVVVLGPCYCRCRACIRWLISHGKETRSDSALEILRQRYLRRDKKEELRQEKKIS